MKLCKDCKHFVALDPCIPICCHPDSPRDKVWGVHASCIAMRDHPYIGSGVPHCGPDGEWFYPSDEGTEEANG